MKSASFFKKAAFLFFIGLATSLVSITAIHAAEYVNPAVPGEGTAAYWMDKGGLYSTYGNFPAAIRAYEASLSLEPNNSEAYFDMGVAYSEMGDYQKALEFIAKAITLDPENGRYHYGRAWTLILAGRITEAEADMVKAAGYGNLDARNYLQR